MPAYKKISPATGRASWYVSFYYTDWTGEKKQKKKEGFDTRKAALEFERGLPETWEEIKGAICVSGLFQTSKHFR